MTLKVGRNLDCSIADLKHATFEVLSLRLLCEIDDFKLEFLMEEK